MPRVDLRNGKVIEEQDFTSSNPEKELQKWVEKYLYQFFHCYHLKSFYKIPGGEIDTLAVTEDGIPCIIEYKHRSNDKLINQIVFYYDWIQDRSTRYEFERIVNENNDTEEMTVDWSSVRLITIAKEYTKWDRSLLKHLDTDIECYSYTYHEDALDIFLDPIINQYKNKPGSGGNRGQTSGYTLEDHRTKAKDEFKPYFDSLRNEILNLGEDIEEGYAPEYIKYVVDTSFLGIHVRKEWLVLLLRVDDKQFDDPKNLTKDITHLNWSVNKQFRFDRETNMEDALYLIRQAYDAQKT